MHRTIALGSFDGLHLGHREVIRRAAEEGPAAVVCFEPVPRQYFRTHPCPMRLTTSMERLALLREQGADMLVWPFDRDTASLEPGEFLDRVAAGCVRVVAGYDFHFGRGRSGGPDLLREWCRQRGVEAVIVGAVRKDGSPVKSRRIRRMLREGDTIGASGLLGRDYGVRGPVARGKGHGRKLGFRTLNVRTPGPKLLPAEGSYAARLRTDEGTWDGAAFVPEGARSLLEVHIPGFDGVPYGAVVEVELGPFLAPPREGLDVGELRSKIATEVEKAMEVCRRWR
ncbi:MAG: riboflavin kinase [Candidatus Fermentibacteraceae bacterium]